MGLVAGPFVESEMLCHGIKVQSLETATYFAFHQTMKWALTHLHLVTMSSMYAQEVPCVQIHIFKWLLTEARIIDDVAVPSTLFAATTKSIVLDMF